MTLKNTLYLLFVVILLVALIINIKGRHIEKINAREVMELAMEIVQYERPPAPVAGIFYAEVAKQYYEDTKLVHSYTKESLQKIYARVIVAEPETVAIPVGEEYWISPRDPVLPHISDYPRFVVDTDFTYTVPPPPVYGSPEYIASLKVVKEAAENRTSEEEELVQYWAGVTGTVSPGGIWQNKLWEVAEKYNLTDREYAYAQMALATGIADAFMECWEVKYRYWTKRPDMADPTIPVSFSNPNFPSYVSGHATISYTAGTLLAHLFPQDATQVLRDAENAKNSRLWAGIHFAHDNEEGAKLGTAIAEFLIQKLQLESLRGT